MIKLVNVSKYYHDENSVVLGLSKVNLELNKGEFVAITGESGSGKSTLLNVISGIDSYEDGEMYINGEETSYYSKEDWELYRKEKIGFIFQNYNLIDYLSPIENIRLVNKKASEGILIELGLDEKQIRRNVMKLSGGQQQRVAIARALVSEAPIILADEPTGNLDRATAGEIIEMLKKLAKERNKCVIVVTHSKEVADAADVILELSGKKLKQVSKITSEV